jgi:NAD+ kinase
VKPLTKIAIAANSAKDGAREIAEAIELMAREAGLDVRSTCRHPVEKGFLEDRDACFVIGGDGTLLGLLDEVVDQGVPVAGVRHGQLGFLATFSPEEAQEAFPPILEGKYGVAHRAMLACEDASGRERLALNDVVIKSAGQARLARLAVFEGDDLVAEYSCDGLIFSTPTGSTAYNLSAGGPIVHPSANVVLMTPICPHTLTSRSVVFDGNAHLRIQRAPSDATSLSVATDGRELHGDAPRFPLNLRVSEKTFPLLQEQDHSHFKVLRNRLKWG